MALQSYTYRKNIQGGRVITVAALKDDVTDVVYDISILAQTDGTPYDASGGGGGGGAVTAVQLPATVGSKADAASLAVTQSTEDKAVLAALSAKLPASVGSKADADSLAVTQSTEDKVTLTSINDKLSIIQTKQDDLKALHDSWSAGGAAEVIITGTAGAAIVGDAANGLDVDVTRLPALAAGSANIGDVDVLTLPALVAGSANIGDVDVLTLPALVAGSALIGKVDHAATGIGHGVKVVAAAGTDEALAGSTAAKWVTIQAQSDNTTRVAVGATGVDAVIATGNGISLAAGDSITLAIDNLADVFVDALTSGEGVRYIYGT